VPEGLDRADLAVIAYADSMTRDIRVPGAAGSKA